MAIARPYAPLTLRALPLAVPPLRIVAVIALAAFVTVQARSAHPLLPLRILASRNRGGAYASIALAMFANYGAFLFLTRPGRSR